VNKVVRPVFEIQAITEGLTFWVLVQPRSSKVAIVGHHHNALKIKLTAAPVDGAANQQCIEVLAKTLNRPKSTITIVSGHTARRKQILIQSKAGPLTPAEKRILEQQLHRLGAPISAANR
jgi:uncharacterized protein